MYSYTGFATRDDVYKRNHNIIHAYTAVTHDAIITVSSCVTAAGAPLSC